MAPERQAEPGFGSKELPTLESFTLGEQFAARWLVAQARVGSGDDADRLRHLVAVAGLLDSLGAGAQLPDSLESPWDVRLGDGTTLLLRRGTKAFELSRPAGAKRSAPDVWVFAPTDGSGAPGDRYFVASAAYVKVLRENRKRLSLATAEAVLPSTSRDGLSDTVAATLRGTLNERPDALTLVPTDEPDDRVKRDPETTEWRRAARRHQRQWREDRGWPPGLVRRKRGELLSGDRLARTFAEETGANFLAPELRPVAEHVARQLPGRDRRDLATNLLSSRALAINVFGSLWRDPVVAQPVLSAWFPDVCSATGPVGTEVGFAWLPEEDDPAHRRIDGFRRDTAHRQSLGPNVHRRGRALPRGSEPHQANRAAAGPVRGDHRTGPALRSRLRMGGAGLGHRTRTAVAVAPALVVARPARLQPGRPPVRARRPGRQRRLASRRRGVSSAAPTGGPDRLPGAHGPVAPRCGRRASSAQRCDPGPLPRDRAARPPDGVILTAILGEILLSGRRRG
ncbi:MAG: hypothetical protein R2705_02065 [Ilumatobacteraceae bacterium]